ncbi:hypothetical protein VFPPC_15357 [Pochonia chlamydosporia 170]|uniref:Uncharacterized protein n=1 Tax=Pochonia chlamydosporia 170 TaxID=1380566 RepID=A0A179G8E2_METCM|nr:hypothetical protein VFPPC_15357 [Pochonia chlamydosporia 170]OAQ73760.1 hypothetical protein VFPPC_15357 [Pochonia chlamydosporia 170]
MSPGRHDKTVKGEGKLVMFWPTNLQQPFPHSEGLTPNIGVNYFFEDGLVASPTKPSEHVASSSPAPSRAQRRGLLFCQLVAAISHVICHNGR